MINKVEKNYNLLNTSLFNFKVTKQDGTILWVPNDEANTDYQAIQEWAAIEGNNITDPGA